MSATARKRIGSSESTNTSPSRSISAGLPRPWGGSHRCTPTASEARANWPPLAHPSNIRTYRRWARQWTNSLLSSILGVDARMAQRLFYQAPKRVGDRMISNRVLVVDDEPAILDGLTFMLRADGMDAAGASDRLSAQQLVGESFYPVIVTD